MGEGRKGSFAPVAVVVCITLYYALIALGAIVLPVPTFVKVLAVAFSLAVSAVLMYVLRERIREIRSGEEDDLDDY